MAKFFCPFFFLVFFFVFFFVQAEICVENTVVFPVVDDFDHVRTKRFGFHKTVDFDNDFYRTGSKHFYKTVFDKETRTPFLDTFRTVKDVRTPFFNTFMDTRTPFVDTFRTVKDVRTPFFNTFMDTRTPFVDTFRTVKDVRTPFFNTFMDTRTPFLDTFRTVKDVRTPFFDTYKDTRTPFVDTFRTVKDVRTPFFNTFVDTRTPFHDTVRTVKDVRTPFFDTYRDTWTPFVDTFRTVKDVRTPFFDTYRDVDTTFGKRVVDDDFLIHKRFLGDHTRVFDFSNDVGDYVRTVEGVGNLDIVGLDIDRTVVRTDDMTDDRTYRVNFFKDNFDVIRTKTDCDCVCPNTIPTGDFNDKVIREFVVTDLVNKVYNNKNFPKLSFLGKRMKFVILSMANSDDYVLRRVAFLFTTFMHAHLNHIDSTTTCVFTKVIDLSVKYELTHDATVLRDLVHLVSTVFDTTVKRMGVTTAETGKCHFTNVMTKFVTFDTTFDVCHVDTDVVTVFNTVWTRYGKFLPVTYRRVVEDLFKSTYVPDRFMATVATFVLVKEVGVFVENFDTYTMFEMINMMGTETVPECCCTFRNLRFDELIDHTTVEIDHTFTRTVQFLTVDTAHTNRFTDNFVNTFFTNRVMDRFL